MEALFQWTCGSRSLAKKKVARSSGTSLTFSADWLALGSVVERQEGLCPLMGPLQISPLLPTVFSYSLFFLCGIFVMGQRLFSLDQHLNLMRFTSTRVVNGVSFSVLHVFGKHTSNWYVPYLISM